MPDTRRPGHHVELIRDEVAFGALEPAWRALERRCAAEFSTLCFEETWRAWAPVGKPLRAKPMIVVGRCDGEAVLISMLMRRGCTLEPLCGRRSGPVTRRWRRSGAPRLDGGGPADGVPGDRGELPTGRPRSEQATLSVGHGVVRGKRLLSEAFVHDWESVRLTPSRLVLEQLTGRCFEQRVVVFDLTAGEGASKRLWVNV